MNYERFSFVSLMKTRSFDYCLREIIWFAAVLSDQKCEEKSGRKKIKTLQDFKSWPFNPRFQHLALGRLWCDRGRWVILVLSRCVVLIPAYPSASCRSEKPKKALQACLFLKQETCSFDSPFTNCSSALVTQLQGTCGTLDTRNCK